MVAGEKRPEHEADFSPSSDSEIENDWSLTSAVPYAFVACAAATLQSVIRIGWLHGLLRCETTMRTVHLSRQEVQRMHGETVDNFVPLGECRN